MEESNLITINEVKENFKHHIDDPQNDRIIFSGKFGIGKTFFLRDFFDNDYQYQTIFISPINYTVRENLDIFQLIKADILFQLLKEGEFKLEKDFKITSSSVLFYSYFSDFGNILPSLLALIPLISSNQEINFPPQAETALKAFSNLKEIFKKFREKLNKKIISQDSEINEFWDNLNTPGSPYELDMVSLFINEILEQRAKKEKINVLVVDDIDRLDPDHVFRILNILSAHNHHLGSRNKYKFDKIILVCDVQNIEHMFSHKYGPEVNFEGYMDKFYSTDYYPFTNEQALSLYINSEKFTFLSEHGKFLLKFILKHLLDVKEITFRQIIKTSQLESYSPFEIVFPGFSLKDISGMTIAGVRFDINIEEVKIPSTSIDFSWIIKCLKIIFGDLKKLTHAIENVISKNGNNTIPEEQYKLVIHPLIVPIHFQHGPKKSFFHTTSESDSTNYLAGRTNGIFYHIKLVKSDIKVEGNCAIIKNLLIQKEILPTNQRYTPSIKDFFSLIKTLINNKDLEPYYSQL